MLVEAPVDFLAGEARHWSARGLLGREDWNLEARGRLSDLDFHEVILLFHSDQCLKLRLNK